MIHDSGRQQKQKFNKMLVRRAGARIRGAKKEAPIGGTAEGVRAEVWEDFYRKDQNGQK